MTPEEQGCYDALREDNDCFKQENAALRSRLAKRELERDLLRQDLAIYAPAALARIDAFLAADSADEVQE